MLRLLPRDQSQLSQSDSQIILLEDSPQLVGRQSRLSLVVIEPPVVSIRDRKTQELLGQLKSMRKEKSRLAGSNVPRQSFIRQFGSLLKRNRE